MQETGLHSQTLSHFLLLNDFYF